MSAPFTADTHVHIYPAYRPARLLNAAHRRLGGGPDPVVLALTESSACHFFADLAAGSVRAEGWTVRSVPADPDALALTRDADGAALWLVRGRQLITRPRLEVLALGCDPGLPDGIELDDALETIRARDGLPVLPWSPGKWTGRRGAVLRATLDRADPGLFALGDTALRPACWPEPRLMREARARGFRVLNGSDPLPLHGEEDTAGRYATRFDTGFDSAAPARALVRAARDPAVAATTAGRRHILPAVAARWLRNEWARRIG